MTDKLQGNTHSARWNILKARAKAKHDLELLCEIDIPGDYYDLGTYVIALRKSARDLIKALEQDA